jgi:F0F1-type ATP synthase membrane subunit b/b'
MASGLNLIPNPGVMAVIATVFLLAMQVIKIYFLQPFQQLHQKRSQLTSGGKDEAEQKMRSIAAREGELKEKLAMARESASAAKDRVLSQSKDSATRKISAAKAEAEGQLQTARREISDIFSKESLKIQPQLSRLVDAAFEVVVQR